MKKAIYRKFIIAVAVALALCGGIFYFVVGNVLFDTSKQDMLFYLQGINGLLDYDANLQEQVDALNLSQKAQRITIIDAATGDVLAESDAGDAASMDNHIEREEIVGALKDGIGYSKRYSDTMQSRMLYVAILSDGGNHILRYAVPFRGITEYLAILLPVLLISMGASLVVSAFLSERFSKTISDPLQEITEELSEVREGAPEFVFNEYRYEELNVITGTIEKLSERMKRYIERIEFEKHVRQEFFSNASHELKTPLTSIIGYTELLQSGMIENEEQQADFLGRIRKESDNMANLINDILMISRLETKEVQAPISDVRMSLILDDVLKTVKPMALASHVTVSAQCRPIVVKAYPKHMEELLGNLISNAIKYNRENGMVIVTLGSEGKDMVLTVFDSGVGISAEDQKHIFERFYRVDKGRNKKVGGTGLGLSIVKHIVAYYDGTIEVTSTPGVGTTFVVHLPLIAGLQ